MVARGPDEGRMDAAQGGPDVTVVYTPESGNGNGQKSLPVAHAEVVAPYAGEFQESLQDFNGLGRGGMGVVYGARPKEPRASSIITMKQMVGPFVASALRGRTEHLSQEQQDLLCASLRANIDTIRDLVAVKVLNLPEDPEKRQQVRERFVGREVRTMIMSRLPGCPKIYCGTERNGQIELCMEYIDGFNGAQLNAARGKPWDVRMLCELAAHEARVLHHAHEAGIIHRDIKPSNFMVTKDGEVKLMDFGLVKPTDPLASKYTGENQLLGTPDYMSPEQARGDLSVDEKTDVYSYGVMLIERLTGQIPGRGLGGNAMRTIEQRQHIVGPPSLAAYRTSVLPTIDPRERIFVERYLLPMLWRMMGRDPAKRPTTAQVAEFFQHASSFGSSTFETDWIPHEGYPNHRLMLLPPEGDRNGDFVMDDAHKMVEALERGLTVRTRDHDFLEHLDALKYQEGPETVDLRVRKSPVKAISVGVAALVLSAVGLAVYVGSRERGKENANLTSRPVAAGTSPSPDVVTAKPKEFPPPRVFLESQDNVASKLTFFNEDPVEIPAENLVSLYPEDQKFCGVAFWCEPEIFRRLMRLKSVGDVPERLKTGQFAYVVLSDDGNRLLVQIAGLGKMLVEKEGKAEAYTDIHPWLEARGGRPEGEFSDAIARGKTVLNVPRIVASAPGIPANFPKRFHDIKETRPNVIAETVNAQVGGILKQGEKRAVEISQPAPAASQ